MIVKVLFDTNLLISMLERPVDVVSRVEELLEVKVEPVILRVQLQEIEKMARTKRLKISQTARALLSLISNKFIIIESPDNKVDEAIVEVSKRESLIVATNDRELRRKLRRSGVTTIYMKSNGKFEVEGYRP
ncbi:MAG: hypothetical protein N3F04_03365 [Candidatus Nezhaarchaeota archaeon]|nr:hypothetical protein [Candidatus Nezhaarchaeota archaeon]MCX8141802.1 hypothetical protein [Candidatus Nezhaarchaeota archaeon]MDW8050417.1 hypothetical protein [Nitrososphaerota archaeon]